MQRVRDLQAKNTELDKRVEALEHVLQTAAPRWDFAAQKQEQIGEVLKETEMKCEIRIAGRVTEQIQWQLTALKNLLHGQTESARCLPLASLIADLQTLFAGGFVNGRRLVQREQ